MPILYVLCADNRNSQHSDTLIVNWSPSSALLKPIYDMMVEDASTVEVTPTSFPYAYQPL